MLVTLVPTDTDWILLIGMLLGTVRVPCISILSLVSFVRVNVVGYSANIVTGPEPKKVGLLPMLTLRIARLLELSKVTVLTPEPVNAVMSILVTEDGMVIDFKLDASRKALAAILVKEFGIVYDV